MSAKTLRREEKIKNLVKKSATVSSALKVV